MLLYIHSATYLLYILRNVYICILFKQYTTFIMIGRSKEIEILEKAYQSAKPELVAVFGRRRVGKTYLIRSFFEKKLTFELTGLKDGTKSQQLRNFAYSLKDAQKTDLPEPPKDWLAAFYQLKNYLEILENPKEKKVIFIDELPWIATAKSDFLTGFSYFWNSYASKNNILVVICGSATAWMIQKIINDKGGLHNRVTLKIHLAPFSLAETEAYFNARNIAFDRYQLLQLYLTMGGIPHYLDQVEGGKSAVQNIDNICFQPQGMLRTEFDNLYSSLFVNPERYEAIILALSSAWKGLNRTTIIEKTSIQDGGGLTTMLDELEQSGFISSYIPFGKKKKNTLYRLTDYYSLFYLKFIKDIPSKEIVSWNTLSQSQSWKTWSGYAFENICMQHIASIKKALGISGIHSNQYSFLAKPTTTNEGTQIDLLIDRQDNVISICEIKFYNDTWALSKQNAMDLMKKRNIFRQVTGTKKQLFMVLICTYGLEKNQHSIGLIDSVLDMNDLFND